MKLRKKIIVLVLSLLLFFPLLVPVKVQAAEKKYVGSSVSKGNSITLNYKDFKDGLIIRNQNVEIKIINASAPCYVIGFLGSPTKDKQFCRQYLIYSTSPFSLTERVYGVSYGYDEDGVQSWSSNFSNPSYSKGSTDSGKGIYYYIKNETVSYEFEDGYSNIGSNCPMYREYCNLSDVENKNRILQELADGTFDDNHKENYVDDSDLPEFNDEDSNYRKGLGYLKNIHRSNLSVKEAYPEDDPDLGGLSHMEYSYKYKYDSKSTTGFDLNTEKTYIRVYATLAVYDDKGDGKNVLKNMPRRYVTQYKAGNLAFTVKQSDVDKVMRDLLDKIDTASFKVQTLLNNYVRDDTLWFQIVHYNGTSWEYGGFSKYTHTKDGQGKKEDYNPDDTKDDDSKDEIDDQDEGEGDSEDEAIEDAENNDSEFTDFDSILDSLTDSIGRIPQLLSKVFSFLPGDFIGMLVAGITIIIVCRIFGR